uniref:TGF-beta family profile domain-containing protein n=1 Tax=Ditylenchus dipsaci TaxID=166011 RepID=A0A915DCU8_9BILA
MMGFGRMDDNKETAKSNLLPFPTKLKVEETSDEVREFNVNTDDRIQGNDVTLVLLDQQKEKQTIARKKCQKRSLKINFRDIGWDKWIIAPESFEAGYCDGSCSYPLEEDGHPSNHAILQSILRTTNNQYSHLPQACCAPDATDSLTLLYYDENENVVLKNYPKMLITSCGFRFNNYG